MATQAVPFSQIRKKERSLMLKKRIALAFGGACLALSLLTPLFATQASINDISKEVINQELDLEIEPVCSDLDDELSGIIISEALSLCLNNDSESSRCYQVINKDYNGKSISDIVAQSNLSNTMKKGINENINTLRIKSNATI